MTSRDPLIPLALALPRRDRRVRPQSRTYRGAGRSGAPRVCALRIAQSTEGQRAAVAAGALSGSGAYRPGAGTRPRELRAAYHGALDEMGADAIGELKAWPKRFKSVTQEKYLYKVRGRDVTGDNYTISLSAARFRRSPCRVRRLGRDPGVRAQREPAGGYPYTAAVYPYRREQEDPTRMFAGEGPPERTNRASTTSRAITQRRVCRRRSIPRRSTARIPIRGRTSTAAPATRACRSRRSTT